MNGIPDSRRILIVTRNLPPLVGGMERLNWHMGQELAKMGEVCFVAPSGAAAEAPAGVRVNEVALNPLPRFLLTAQWSAWRTARRWRPDIVIAGSGLTAPAAWLAARSCGAMSAAYVHGLDMAIRHPVYRALWLPALRRMDRIIANSRATRELAMEAGVGKSRIRIVHPGVDLATDPPGASAIAAFRENYVQGAGPVLLSVGRLTRRKGLREFVTNVLPRIVSKRPDTVLLVIGDSPHRALRADPQTRESIQDAAQAAGVGKHIRFLGVITDRSKLATAYRAADVHVFPVQQIAGDPEGFGMVAIEAAAEGLPTVAYATGGIIDAVAEGRSGHLVPPGDSSRFAQAVLAVLDDPAMRASSAEFARRFAWPEFGRSMHDALENDERLA